jgi:hypothetical protein
MVDRIGSSGERGNGCSDDLYVHVAYKTRRSDCSFQGRKICQASRKTPGFVGATTSGQLKREFFEEQYQSWLYASDEVVEAINVMVRLVIENQGSVPEPEAG